MTAAIHDFRVEQGVTWTPRVIYADSNNVAINLVNYTAKMQVRPTDTSPDLIIELSTANGRITFDAPNGVIFLRLTAAETAALVAGNYVYDLRLTRNDGIADRVIAGNFIVVEVVTV